MRLERRFWHAYVECPNEKYVPTVTAFCPVASKRRVIKSMAWLC